MFNDAGIDVLQALGVNRDFVRAEEVALVYSGTSIHPYVDECETLTLRVSNLVTPSGQTVIDLYYALGA